MAVREAVGGRILEGLGKQGGRRLHWYIDGMHIESSEAAVNLALPPSPRLGVRAVLTDDWGDAIWSQSANISLSNRPNSGPRSGGSSEGGVVVSCLHTTRGRPEQAVGLRDAWLARAKNASRVEWVFAVDSDDPESIAYLLPLASDGWKVEGAATRVVVVPVASLYHGGGSCVAGWNMAALKAKGDVVMCVADDLEPPGEWDAELVKRVPLAVEAALIIGDGLSTCRVQVVPGGDRVVAYGPLQSHPIVNRMRLESLGYVLFPEYRSVYCDDDFTW